MYTVLATETATSLTDTLKPIMDQISSAVSVGDIVGMLGVAVAFGIPFFLGWMGIRKIVKIATSAVSKGKISA